MLSFERRLLVSFLHSILLFSKLVCTYRQMLSMPSQTPATVLLCAFAFPLSRCQAVVPYSYNQLVNAS